MSDEEFCICPYNKMHRLIRFRMPGHMVKCRRSYRGPPLEQCIYNAMHLVPEGTMAKHLEDCEDCYKFNFAHFVEMADRGNVAKQPKERSSK